MPVPKQRPYYPIFLDVEGRLAVIVGGGAVSARKAESLARHGARVVVVAPDLGEDLRTLVNGGAGEWRAKRFEESDLEGAAMAIASTDDADVNKLVAESARSRGIPVNVVDAPELCDFIVPAVIESGSIQVAISTGGRSPALARRLKKELEQVIGPEYAEVSDLLGALREAAIAALPNDTARRQFFDSILESDVTGLLRAGKRDGAYELLARICEGAGVPAPRRPRTGSA